MKTKVEIANNFILSHKEIEEWAPFHLSGDAKLEHIFNNILQGLYGECREVDDLLRSGEYEIEISSHDSRSGNSVLFNFIEPDFFKNRLSEFAYFDWAKSQGFTNSEILNSLEDGEVLNGISEIDAEEMHYCLTQLIGENE